MGDEKKDDGARDPIKMLLEEALARQRNEIMDWKIPFEQIQPFIYNINIYQSFK